MLVEFFSCDQATNVFPQDRVFILLAALGQRSLTGLAAGNILECILTLLTRLLAPLSTNGYQSFQQTNTGQLDLSLIGWVLLFLSKSLDSVRLSACDDFERTAREREAGSRWNFIHGEAGLHANKFSSRLSATSKFYRRKLQKRLMHHKQQLLDLHRLKNTSLLHSWRKHQIVQ
jgi:baculoviral IAP repeat-containing protein 6